MKRQALRSKRGTLSVNIPFSCMDHAYPASLHTFLNGAISSWGDKSNTFSQTLPHPRVCVTVCVHGPVATISYHQTRLCCMHLSHRVRPLVNESVLDMTLDALPSVYIQVRLSGVSFVGITGP